MKLRKSLKQFQLGFTQHQNIEKAHHTILQNENV